jgi:hypothetical protein
MSMFVRRVPRLQTSLQFLLPDGWKGEVVDLSANGLRLQCLLMLDKDSEVSGTLVFPDGKRLEIQGTVVWTADPVFEHHVPAELGIELSSVSQEYLDALASLFAED